MSRANRRGEVYILGNPSHTNVHSAPITLVFDSIASLKEHEKFSWFVGKSEIHDVLGG